MYASDVKVVANLLRKDVVVVTSAIVIRVVPMFGWHGQLYTGAAIDGPDD